MVEAKETVYHFDGWDVLFRDEEILVHQIPRPALNLELCNQPSKLNEKAQIVEITEYSNKWVIPYKNGYNHIIQEYKYPFNFNERTKSKNRIQVFTIGSNHPNNSNEGLFHGVAEGLIIYKNDTPYLIKGNSGLVGITLEEIHKNYFPGKII